MLCVPHTREVHEMVAIAFGFVISIVGFLFLTAWLVGED
jgi:hypothetical protein